MRLRNSVALLAIAALASLAGCTPRPAETGVFIDPQFASLVPPDTTLLVGLRVENLVKTPIYRKYLSGGKIPIINKFTSATGVNPEKSLWNLLFVSNGRRSFVLGRGKFADELMAPDFSKKDVRRFGYRGLTLFGDEQQAMLLVNSSTIAMGDTETLRALVDQRPSINRLPVRLSTLSKEMPRESQFWSAYAGGPVDVPLSGNLANINKILGLIASGTFSFDFTDGVQGTMTGVALNELDAQQVHDGLAGMLGIGRMMAPKNQPEIGRVFEGINVAQEGTRVTIKIVEPEELAGALVAMWMKQ